MIEVPQTTPSPPIPIYTARERGDPEDKVHNFESFVLSNPMKCTIQEM